MISSFKIPSNIQSEIDLVENLMLVQADDYHPDLKAAVRILITTGGKRIRPLIILLITHMLQGTNEQIINLATAIELLHTATLVHDDLIDGSLLRRGVPTLNSKWSPAATVLTGDFLFSCAATIASHTHNLEVIELFSKTLTVIVNGEVNQLFSSRCNASKEDYYNRIYSKTASLFETSTHSAAILCGASPVQVESLKKLGYSMGMAFQIIDDILDYTGDQNKIGKPVGGDLRQGLITLPMLFFMNDNPTDPAVIKLNDGKCISDDDELDRIIKLVSSSSAIDQSLDEANRFILDAKNSLKTFEDCHEKVLLEALTTYIIERKL